MELYPEDSAVPEAMYFSGVNLFKQTNDSSRLKMTYEKLLSNYPDSTWTKRAYPYRLL